MRDTPEARRVYKEQVERMSKLFACLDQKARNLLIEAMGEIQGQINAGMLEEAILQAQGVKDMMSYPTMGIEAAVFSKWV